MKKTPKLNVKLLNFPSFVALMVFCLNSVAQAGSIEHSDKPVSSSRALVAVTSPAEAVVAEPKVRVGSGLARANLSLEQTMLLAENVAKKGDPARALALYDAVLEISPDNQTALLQSSLLLSQQQQHEAAVERHQRLVMLDSGDIARRANHSVLLMKAGNPVSAAKLMQKLLLEQPDFHSVRNNFVRVLIHPEYGVGEPVQALPLAVELNRLTGSNNPVYLDTLAAAQHAVGDSAGAAITARAAVDKALQNGMLPLAKAISDQVLVYEASADVGLSPAVN